MSEKQTLLLVDDEPLNIGVLNDFLLGNYRTRIATSGGRALALARQEPLPDLVLLDVNMPDMDGYAVCHQLKADPLTAAIPVIFLTAHDQPADITRGFAVGAVDYVGKPVIPDVLLARVQTHLRLTETRRQLEYQNQHLEALVAERTEALRRSTDELAQVQELSIVALGALAETRDNETGNHIHRTQAYVRLMVERMRNTRMFGDQLQGEAADIVWRSAPLHDIGKVGITDQILMKPGKLTPDEFEVMKQHTVLGRDALLLAERRAGLPESFLHTALDIAYSHHERWDGKGYPQGLAGGNIPLAARLMAVADVYDALITRRVYKPAFTHEVAIDMIRDGRGSQFDPDIADCFLDLGEMLRTIAQRFADDD